MSQPKKDFNEVLENYYPEPEPAPEIIDVDWEEYTLNCEGGLIQRSLEKSMRCKSLGCYNKVYRSTSDGICNKCRGQA